MSFCLDPQFSSVRAAPDFVEWMDGWMKCSPKAYLLVQLVYCACFFFFALKIFF